MRRPSENKRQAGRYVLGDLLGRGGMAEVFAGHSIGDHGFQKPVAIKRLLPELANDKVFVDRLIQEAKLLVGMTHGNVVSVIDLARDGEDVFLVMDFVDGPSLRQLLKARGAKTLPLGIASYIVQSAAAGLEFAHARPGGAIIHADISPSNLLLTTSGEVRVADFGIARREGGGWGIVEGKWAYMAPEQARGEPLTPRSDVFALGVVLYELITGAHPFGRQVTAEERESGQMRVIPPRIVKPSVPPGLDAICMRALAHDPRDRYARMQHMIDAIMDERFTNQWREGASDLAALLGEAAPAMTQSGAHANVMPGGPRTMVTDRPVTLFTRSLIDMTPARRSSANLDGNRASRPSKSQMSSSASASRGSAPLSAHDPADSAMETREAFSASASASAASVGGPSSSIIVEPQDPAAPTPQQAQAAAMAKLLEMPAIFNPNGPAMPQFRLGGASSPSQDELGSVNGGNTAASIHDGGIALGDPRTNRWAIAVLALAAILGVVAAVVLQMKPSSQAQAAPAQETKPADPTSMAVATAPTLPGKTTAPATNPAAGKDLSAPDPDTAPATGSTQPPPQQPTVTPPPSAGTGELPLLTDPSTIAPDPETLAKEQEKEKERARAAASPPKPTRVERPERRPDRTDRNDRNDRRRDDDEEEISNRPSARAATKSSRDMGFLRVNAYPWGWVSIDGGPRKTTPVQGLQLPAGTYTIKIYTDDASKVRKVEIEPGKVKQINVDWEEDVLIEK